MSQQKVAIVTGGARGIGAATTRALVAKGYAVCIGYRADEAAATQLVATLQADGGQVSKVQADIGTEAGVLDLFAACDSEYGRLDALVNNAGVVADKARVDEYSIDRIRALFDVNVLGTVLCCREAVRRMSTRHGGSGGAIVNVSSVASRLGAPGEYVDYAATKAAVDTFTLGLAKEVATEQVRVNAVRPGIIDTDIHASGGQPDRLERLKGQIPMQRGGEPMEVAESIIWLLSDAASYTTGALIDVAGGR